MPSGEKIGSNFQSFALGGALVAQKNICMNTVYKTSKKLKLQKLV